MADSKKKNDISADNFADDLDAMLNDVDSSAVDQGELINDEEAIDRLLIDDMFDVNEDSVSTDEGEESASGADDEVITTDNTTSDSLDSFDEDDLLAEVAEQSKTDDAVDEILDDSQEDKAQQPATKDSADSVIDDSTDTFNIDDLLDSVVSEVSDSDEIDEFAENDVVDPVDKSNSVETSEDEFDIDDLLDSVTAEDEGVEEKDSATDLVDESQSEEASEDEFDIDDLLDSVSAEVEEVDNKDEFAEDSATDLVDESNSVETSEKTLDVDDLLDSVVAEAEVVDEIDEFIEDTQSEPKAEVGKPMVEESENDMAENKDQDLAADDSSDQFDVDDLLDSVAEDSSSEVDDFAESDDDDDFLMADFDISADDVESETDDLEDQSQSVTSDAENAESNSLEDQTVVVAQTPPLQNAAGQEENNLAIAEMRAQINQLWAENENYKQQLADLASSSKESGANGEEIETLQKDQRNLRKSIKESEGQVPVLVYVALGVAILALLVGGGLGAIGYGAQSSGEELAELVLSLEEEIEVLNSHDMAKEVKKVNKKLLMLDVQDKQVNKQVTEINHALKTNSLQPVVDDLVKQNDHAQVAIEKLFAKVEDLANRKIATVSSPKKRKKVVVKVDWVVNLVSFKQEWYAKRKAAEYKKKGVLAKVMKVKVNGENWFRLTVTGFKSKYKAAAFAVKVKKTLNLSSVWVTKA